MSGIYSVTQVNRYIKNMFSQDYLLQSVRIRGEVSNCKYHSSGHLYFTLKDEGGALNCVMFSSCRGGLGFVLRDGQQVVAEGNVAVFERDGKYQLYARSLTRDGEGALFEEFQRLKLRLQEMGLFEAMYKRPIPAYIHTLGVVTAPTGAAIRDIIQIVKRRNPFVRILLYPALVQGEGAVSSIVQGIRALEEAGVEVMIVGRGGGSLEDLWAFNSEEVARAVFGCSVPVISAVGHETDTTIIDFAADMRAPTPSAAAELAVYEVSLLLAQLRAAQDRLNSRMAEKIRLERLKVDKKQLLLNNLSPMNRLQEKRFACLRCEDALREGFARILRQRQTKLQLLLERLQGLSPVEKLRQGYSYTVDESGTNIRSVHAVQPGDRLHVHVADGLIHARAESCTS